MCGRIVLESQKFATILFPLSPTPNTADLRHVVSMGAVAGGRNDPGKDCVIWCNRAPLQRSSHLFVRHGAVSRRVVFEVVVFFFGCLSSYLLNQTWLLLFL